MLRRAEPMGRSDPEHAEFGRGDIQGSSILGHLSQPERAPYLVFPQNQFLLQQRSLPPTQHGAPDGRGARILDLVTSPCQNTHHLCRMGKKKTKPKPRGTARFQREAAKGTAQRSSV